MRQFDIRQWFNQIAAAVPAVSAETLGWLAVIFLHSATVPTLLALSAGISDDMPALDLVLMVWAGLVALFAQAVVRRNTLQMITISAGFVVQCVLLALIFFK